MIINSSSNSILKNSLCIYKLQNGNLIPVRKANELNTTTSQYKDKNDVLRDAGTFTFFAMDMDEADTIKALLDVAEHPHVRLGQNPIASLNYEAEDSDAYFKCRGAGQTVVLECDGCGALLSTVVNNGKTYKAAHAVAGDEFMTLTEISSPYTCPACAGSIDLILWR